MTTYLVQIKCDENEYETVLRTSSRSRAFRTSYELAQESHDGRIVTEKGHVSQEWEINRD